MAACCLDSRLNYTPLKEGLVRTIGYFEDLLKEEGVRAVVGIEK